MVGDDPTADIAAAKRLGLRGFLVLSGKSTGDAAFASRVRPDLVAGSLADIVAGLDSPP
jgi:ribonucleotide monophosphatase NagD (HAD superfamily)